MGAKNLQVLFGCAKSFRDDGFFGMLTRLFSPEKGIYLFRLFPIFGINSSCRSLSTI